MPTPIHRESSPKLPQKSPATQQAKRLKSSSSKPASIGSERLIQKASSLKPQVRSPHSEGFHARFQGLKKQSKAATNTSVQDTNRYEDLKKTLDLHLAQAFQKIIVQPSLEPTSLEDKYTPEAIALLLDKVLQSLNFHSKHSHDTTLSNLDSIANRVLKDFIQQQDAIFKSHFPYLQELLRPKAEAKTLEGVSIKDLIQIVNASSHTPESPYKKSLGLILSTDLSASLTLIALQKLKKSTSSKAVQLLCKQLNTLKDRLDEGLDSLQALELSATAPKAPKLTKMTAKLPYSQETSHAFREELLRSKRFILSLEDTLAELENDSHSYAKRLELWAQQDIKAFLEVLDDKIKIARCIGDLGFESKLTQLKNKLYLYSSYPHTLKLGLKDNEAEKLDPETLKSLLFQQFMQSLKTIGHQDPYLEYKVEQKYLKSAGSLELAFKKIFWVPYPQLKIATGEFLEKFKEMESTLGAIDQLPPGALRNKKSYMRDAQALLAELQSLEPKLNQSLKQAKDKAHSKALRLDPAIESFVNSLKTSLPTPSQLKASGYWLESQ